MDAEVNWLKEMEQRTRDGGSVSEAESKQVFTLMSDDAIWVVRMLVARLLPRIALNPEEYDKALDYLLCQAEGANAFIRAWALHSLAQFAARDEGLRPRVTWMLREAYETDKPSVRACARRGLALLERPIE